MKLVALAFCAAGIHFESFTTWRSLKNMMLTMSFGPMVATNCCASCLASSKLLPMRLSASTRISQAVPTPGCCWLSPQRARLMNLAGNVRAVDVDREQRAVGRERKRLVERERLLQVLAHAVELRVAGQPGATDGGVADSLALRDVDDRGEHGVAVLLRGARIDAQQLHLGRGAARSGNRSRAQASRARRATATRVRDWGTKVLKRVSISESSRLGPWAQALRPLNHVVSGTIR